MHNISSLYVLICKVMVQVKKGWSLCCDVMLHFISYAPCFWWISCGAFNHVSGFHSKKLWFNNLWSDSWSTKAVGIRFSEATWLFLHLNQYGLQPYLHLVRKHMTNLDQTKQRSNTLSSRYILSKSWLF